MVVARRRRRVRDATRRCSLTCSTRAAHRTSRSSGQRAGVRVHLGRRGARRPGRGRPQLHASGPSACRRHGPHRLPVRAHRSSAARPAPSRPRTFRSTTWTAPSGETARRAPSRRRPARSRCRPGRPADADLHLRDIRRRRRRCAITHAKVADPGLVLAERFGLGPDDVVYIAMPMFHSNAIMAGWAVGAGRRSDRRPGTRGSPHPASSRPCAGSARRMPTTSGSRSPTSWPRRSSRTTPTTRCA